MNFYYFLLFWESFNRSQPWNHWTNSSGVFSKMYLSKWVLQSNTKLKMSHVRVPTVFPRSHHILQWYHTEDYAEVTALFFSSSGTVTPEYHWRSCRYSRVIVQLNLHSTYGKSNKLQVIPISALHMSSKSCDGTII